MPPKLSLTTLVAFVAIGFALAGCGRPDGEAQSDIDVRSSALTNQDIAFHWAPIHYQSVDVSTGTHGREGLGDYITRVDYDGEFIGDNNWDSLDNFLINSPPPAHAYYHVAETSTHWILSYIFYHPRDWDNGLDESEHENDMEGAVEFVRKDGSTYGAFEGMVTVYHTTWRLYRNPSATYLTTGHAGPNTINVLRLETAMGESYQRPVTMQQAEGHGLVACEVPGCGVTTGVRYRPSLTDADSTTATYSSITDGRYKLIDTDAPDGLWGHRFDHLLFNSWVNFKGNNSDSCGNGAWLGCDANAAGTPWATSGSGDIFFLFTDPAKMLYEHFAGWDNADVFQVRTFSLDYENRNSFGTPQSFGAQWVPAGADLLTDRGVAAAPGAPALHLFAKVPGGTAQVKYSLYDGANWATSSTIANAPLTDSAPAALTCNQRMYLFVKTGSGAQTVQWTWKDVSVSDSTPWASWATLPSATTNAPVALACREAKVYVFLKGGSDNRVYFTTLATQNNSWGTWSEVPIDGITQFPLTAAVNMNNLELDLFAIGTDYNVWINRLCYGCADTQWTGWAAHPGFTQASSGLSAAWDPVTSPATGVQIFYPKLGDGRIDEDSFDGSSWRGPAMVRGHQYTNRPVAAVPYGYNILLFGVGNGNIVDQHIWMTAGQAPGRPLTNATKQATQISDYAPAARAIDGRTDGRNLTEGGNSLFDGHIDGVWSHGYVSHTNQANYPWWQVDLGSARTITQVEVFNRTDCCMDRLKNWSILVSNNATTWTEVFRDDRSAGAGMLTTLNGSGPMYTSGSVGRIVSGGSWSGRYVRIQINRPNEWLHLADVQVWGY